MKEGRSPVAAGESQAGRPGRAAPGHRLPHSLWSPVQGVEGAVLADYNVNGTPWVLQCGKGDGGLCEGRLCHVRLLSSGWWPWIWSALLTRSQP